jgi:uncharacterized protein (DUF2141 family)
MRGLLILICSFFTHGLTYAQVDTLKTAVNLDKVIPDSGPEKTYTIHITVTHIRNREGVIRFKFYDDSTPFPDLNGFLKVVVPKTEMKGDSLTVTLHGFVPKHMAIALQDDENSDLKLDMGWFFPKEGHAFSDYYHIALRRPVYNDFRFLLNGDRRVVMRMKYY